MKNESGQELGTTFLFLNYGAIPVRDLLALLHVEQYSGERGWECFADYTAVQSGCPLEKHRESVHHC